MARRTGSTMKSESPAAIDQAEYGEDVTRCICGNEEFVSTPRTKALNAEPGLYVQCERCNVWQHGFCMGFEAEADIPNEYYCEKCEPLFHRIGQRQGVLQSRYRPYTPRNGNNINGNGSNNGSSGATSKRVKNGASNDNDNSNEDENGVKSIADSTDAKNGSRRHQSPAESVYSENNTDIKSPAAKLVNDEIYPKQEVDDESSAIHGGELSSESRKRPRQKKSDTELAASFARNRKRRSREDLILQRVLEQSAKEAREAEAKRREQEGLPPLEEEAVLSNGDRSSVEPEQDEQPSKSTSKSQRSRGKSSDTPDEDSRSGETHHSTNASKDTANGKRQSTSRQSGAKQIKSTTRAPRNGRRAAARNTVISSEDSPSKRNASGSKKCKPRIPSPRSTLSEMRRRVGSILDFTSRTQAELVEEQNVNIDSLSNSAGSIKFGSELKLLNSVCLGNMSGLEQLTQKLLQWEEQYGNHSP